MISIKVNKGDMIEFDYDDPKDGDTHRYGTIESAKRAKTTNLIVFTIFDETVKAFRSFHLCKMRNIKVKVQ